MNREDIADSAVTKFLGGYNCAESVLLTMSMHAGIINSLIPKIATPFGGGFARRGSICGCVTGALMYVGAMYGRARVTDDREKAYTLSSNFMDAFERKFESLICYELTDCDFKTQEGKVRWEKEIKESKCAKFVEGAVKILLELESRTEVT